MALQFVFWGPCFQANIQNKTKCGFDLFLPTYSCLLRPMFGLYFKETINYFCQLSRELQKQKRTNFSSNNLNQKWTRILLEYEKWFLHQISPTIRHESGNNQQANLGFISSILRVEKSSRKTKEKVETYGKYYN